MREESFLKLLFIGCKPFSRHFGQDLMSFEG